MGGDEHTVGEGDDLHAGARDRSVPLDDMTFQLDGRVAQQIVVTSGIEGAHDCGELLATLRRPFERALLGERVHPRMERIEQRARITHR